MNDSASLAIMRLFEQSRPPITDLVVLRTLLEEVAAACSIALRDISRMDLAVTLKLVERVPLNKAMPSNIGAVCSLFLLPEWNAQGVVCFSKPLLFRILDSMYGGDNKQNAPVPERPLSQLEQTIAGEFATALFDLLRRKLEPFVAFGLRLVSVDELADASMYEKNATEFALVHFWIVELDEMLSIALPVKGLELARERLTNVSDETAHDIDPDWRHQFEQSVGSTPIEFVASCDGPAMLLRDVAKLHVGSQIEFDVDVLQGVCLDVAGNRMFEGRLGQSKGYFTICLETPIAASPTGRER
jgi:flagellar motor switch protein FliM